MIEQSTSEPYEGIENTGMETSGLGGSAHTRGGEVLTKRQQKRRRVNEKKGKREEMQIDSKR